MSRSEVAIEPRLADLDRPAHDDGDDGEKRGQEGEGPVVLERPADATVQPPEEAVQGWPSAKLRELLADRMLASHPEIYVGEALPPSTPAVVPSLVA